MDYQFEKEWNELTKDLAETFKMDMDLQSVLFLIGVQELGVGFREFKKQEKMDLMHIAICRLLEPYGYYIYSGKDKDGWPHYDEKQKVPTLLAGEQEKLMKTAVIEYFTTTDA
ncbi:MAG TPA: hypothetical protein DHU89_04235 [Flavobacteriales bacterium]|nr:hypothetical protein [Flavobacteriales bacterium]|tara:strand:- start:1396 stop:1734 length:339 start_codon:yes stop_codon:yes gene_type:complete